MDDLFAMSDNIKTVSSKSDINIPSSPEMGKEEKMHVLLMWKSMCISMAVPMNATISSLSALVLKHTRERSLSLWTGSSCLEHDNDVR